MSYLSIETLTYNTPKLTLEKNDEGYVKIILGATNTFNTAGHYYTSDLNDCVLNRNKEGNIYSEVGHPRYETGMSTSEFINRNLVIDSNNICGHIKDVHMIQTDIREHKAQGNVELVVGWVKPYGVIKTA